MSRVFREITIFAIAFLSALFVAFDARAQEVGPTSYVFVEARDTNGTPVPEATVTLLDEQGKSFSSAKTLADGSTRFSYFLRSPFHDVTLQLSKDGYLTSEHLLFFYPSQIGYKSYVGREKFPNAIGSQDDSYSRTIRVILNKVPVSAAQRELLEADERRRKFLNAAKRGDSIKLKEMLDAGVKPNVADNEGVSAIAWAAFAGDSETLKLLLRSVANLRTGEGLANQALLIYSFEGLGRQRSYEQKVIDEHSEVVRQLVQAGASINVRSDYRGTILNNLISRTPHVGQSPYSITTDLVKFLIDAGADVSAVDALGQTPLMVAVEKESVPLTRMLLAAKAGATINLRDNQGSTALIHAIRYASSTAEIVSDLLSHGANPNITNIEGQTALMMASWRKAVAQAKALITAKAAINQKDRNGLTALMYASQGFSAEISSLLVKAGAPKEEKDAKGWTALMHASPRYYNDSGSEVVRFLISVGANVNAVGNDGETALILAARHYDETAVGYLIGAGADVNAKDKQGQTVLMHACQAYTPIRASVFIDAGASATINAKDNKGFTALMYAMSRYYAAEDARQLIAAGANVSEVNNEGQTALMLAAQSGNFELVQMMLSHGARATVNFKDKNGRAALNYVKPRYGYESVTEIVKALVDAGAEPIK